MPLSLTDILTTDVISDGRVKINSNNAAIETFVNNLEDQITILESASPPDADNIAVEDSGDRFEGSNVEAVLAEIFDAFDGHGHDADEIAVADVAGNFTATDVEGVLAELFDAIGEGGSGGPIDIEDVTGLQAALDDKASLTTDNQFAGLIKSVKTLSSNNPVLDLNQGYVFYSENTGSGGASTRLWLSGPTGGEIIVGGRSSGSRLTRLRVRANNIVIDDPTYSGNYGWVVWHSGNDGTGSGLDADTVDGVEASAFALKTGTTFTGEVEFEAPVVIQDIPLRKALFGVGQAKHPAKARPSRIITQFQSGHGWTLANPRGTLSTDTTNYLFGSQSVKITTEGDSNITGLRSGSLGGLDLSDRWLRLWVRVDDSTKLSQLVLYVTSDNFSGYQTYEVAIGGPGNGRTARDNEWFPITVDLENPTTTSGSVDLESISHLQLSVYDNGNPINVWYNDIALIHKKPGAVAIVFDDGLAGVWATARPIMERYGIRGNVAVIASLVGESGCMTVDQLKHLDRYLGWDIIAHHYTDLEAPNGFDTMTEDELREEIELVQTWMFENGFHRGIHHVAYPFGGFNEASINILKDYFVTGRTIINGYETNPMADPMRLRSFNVTSSDSVSTITNLIDKAVANDELLILTFHNVVPGTPATDGEYNASDFEDIIEHLHNTGATVLTVPELVD